jgi:long-chain acyl-CoA synthetase
MLMQAPFIQSIPASFVIIDAVTDKHYSWQQIGKSKMDFAGRLAFLYLDNSINSLLTFFYWYSSGATLALFSKSLSEIQKKALEKNYYPTIIYDESRNEIEAWQKKENYFYQEANQTPIHPSIKILLSTSGSTGSPKLVKLSEENLLANAYCILQYLPISATAIAPLNLLIHYSYGLSVLTTHALAGATVVCGLPDILQKPFWECWEQYGFTSLAGVPFTYEMLNRLGFFSKQLPTLQYFTQAGGRLSEELVKKAATYAQECGKQFFVMYGQTEATARMAYLPPEQALQKPHSIGIAIPGGKFSIDDGSQELLYTGPNVFGGYAETAADLLTYEQIHPLRTGDIARMDEEGYVYITGRIKRFIKLFGNRISLDEVEELIKKIFGLAEVACSGLSDKFLLISYTEPLNRTAINTYLFSQLGIHPTAVKWNPLPTLPLTTNGKINYPEIVRDYDSRTTI